MAKRAGLVQGLVGVFLITSFWLFLPGGLAWAWEAPAKWADVGTVRQWQAVDAEFYRVQDSALYLDESYFNLDQKKAYEKTFHYRGTMPGIGWAGWQELDPDSQAQRYTSAARELKYVFDFRNRLLSQAQDMRQTGSTGWGAVVGDRTVVGDVLSRLYTAVNLDPSNPYVWHLYSYFATLVGDDSRAMRAIRGAEQALTGIPSDKLQELRAAVALDKAWLLRDQGEFAAAHIALETVAANDGKGLEARLLQGLLAAQMGDDRLAITIANELRSTAVGVFPLDIRNGGFKPELGDVSAWRQSRSSYLSDWIQAYTWLREGRVDMARAVLGTHRLDSQRPFAFRFWRDAGAIYEVTGRSQSAQQAWLQARVALPYYPYMVYKSQAVNLARLTGRSGAMSYLLGFDSHFLSGSRLAYGADLVEALAGASDPSQKEKLATRALDQLEICERFGVYSGPAAVLQGQVYYLMNDLASAQIMVKRALTWLDAQGDAAGLQAVLTGLNRPRAELDTWDIANFYGQSGTSRSRWQGDPDPAATLATLQAAYDADPSAGNRRHLARALIGNSQAAAGRELAAAPLTGSPLTAGNLAVLEAKDITLVLEADRALSDTTVALIMVALQQSGAQDSWQSANVWALAGFICVDNGLPAEGKVALQRALELDPGNQGLRRQLSLM